MDMLTKGRTDHSQNTFNGNEALKENNPCPTKTHYTSRPHDRSEHNYKDKTEKCKERNKDIKQIIQLSTAECKR
jgi:hypothetical protein